MAFIDRFMEALESKQISQYKLCKDLEIGQSTISSWKKGKMPTVDKIIAIVRYLEVSADWILETEEKEVISPEEQQILKAYRNALPAIQMATKKLLDVTEPKQIQEEPEQETLSASRTG